MYMKKLIAIFAVTAFVACNNAGESTENKAADSTRIADSLAKAAANVSDSLAKAAANVSDSATKAAANVADSAAKATKK